MKIHRATKRDDARGTMRLELTGDDVELLEGLCERLDKLVQIEEVLEVVAMESPSILGQDLPTVTREGTALVRAIVEGWDPDVAAGEVVEVVEEGDRRG